MFAKWLAPLAEQLQKNSGNRAPVSLVQALLTSSHQGWGLGSVSRDADELLMLMRHLKAKQYSKGVILVGHSTGCQDVVMYASKHRFDVDAAELRGVVLQAPVSDREWLCDLPDTKEWTGKARQLLAEGRENDVAFRAMQFGGAAVTAERWLSLVEPGGEDDMFSSDLTDEQFKTIFEGLQGLDVLLVLSGADEYVPHEVDIPALGHRMAGAIGPTAHVEILKGARHSLDDAVETFVDLICGFVQKVIP